MRILLLLFALLPSLASAAPPCLPGLYGTPAGQVVAGRSSTGWHLGGFCVNAAGQFEHWGIACVHGTCVPAGTLAETVSGYLRSADPSAAAKSAWDSTFKSSGCSKATGALKVVCGEMYAALWEARPWGTPVESVAAPPPLPPAEVWEVAPITSGNRPSQKVVNGARVTMPAPVYLPVGTACNPAITPTFVTTAGTWMGVDGQAADLRWLCRSK